MFGPDPDYQNMMIYPATRKVAIEDPYFTAYDYLEKCLSSTQICLVIGYSFRDYDTLMRFKSAALANKELVIAILDPKANELKETLQRHGLTVDAHPYIFGLQEEEYMKSLAKLLGKAAAAKS